MSVILILLILLFPSSVHAADCTFICETKKYGGVTKHGEGSEACSACRQANALESIAESLEEKRCENVYWEWAKAAAYAEEVFKR